MSKYLSSQAALLELGLRLKSYRIYSALTQEELAIKSGVSRRSIQNMENGEDVNLSTIIKVLMALGLDSNLDLLVPDSTQRPSYYLKTNSNIKRRSRAIKKKVRDLSKEFKWGDES
ncbi:MAG: helix-turn-helix domain-containing protein [Firmicutes bacterium]|nr:helix-turn-helix domain-containing protein [Bacillota bacterium]